MISTYDKHHACVQQFIVGLMLLTRQAFKIDQRLFVEQVKLEAKRDIQTTIDVE